MGTERKDENIIIFTIGFTKKSAREFFNTLKENNVKEIIDIRLNNRTQLAGFTKKEDLEFFLEAIAGIKYKHVLELAPDKQLLEDYQKKRINWEEYEKRFLRLLKERNIEKLINPEELDRCCFLCSEPKPDKCHRRLVAEYLKSIWSYLEITHL